MSLVRPILIKGLQQNIPIRYSSQSKYLPADYYYKRLRFEYGSAKLLHNLYLCVLLVAVLLRLECQLVIRNPGGSDSLTFEL